MAIYDINTIQGDVNTSYGDEYLKQALANLGQRQGLKGDAIQTQTFKISDVIFDSANKIVPMHYIKGYYDATNDVITYTADDESTPLEQSPNYKHYRFRLVFLQTQAIQTFLKYYYGVPIA